MLKESASDEQIPFIRLNSLEFIPVVEFEPAEYRRPDRAYPDFGADDTEWRRHWFDSLADAGIVGIEPLPGSWLVPATSLVDALVLDRLATVSIGRCDAQANSSTTVDPDHIGPMSGGYALQSGGEVGIWPGCCSDLGTLSSWMEASAYRGESWEMVWIGHPWISVRFDQGRLVFSKPHESSEPVSWFSVSPGVLVDAVNTVRFDLDRFEEKLLPVVERLVPYSQARDVVRILVRGHGAFGK